MKFWPHKMTDESAPIEPRDPTPRKTPKDPEPNMSTKPKDIVGYCLGYACPKKHVFGFFDSITPDQYDVRKPCPTCGGISKPAAIRKVCEARWVDHNMFSSYSQPPKPDWRWRHDHFVPGFSVVNWYPEWSRYEFVHYLDPVKPRPKRRKK